MTGSGMPAKGIAPAQGPLPPFNEALPRGGQAMGREPLFARLLRKSREGVTAGEAAAPDRPVPGTEGKVPQGSAQAVPERTGKARSLKPKAAPGETAPVAPRPSPGEAAAAASAPSGEACRRADVAEGQGSIARRGTVAGGEAERPATLPAADPTPAALPTPVPDLPAGAQTAAATPVSTAPAAPLPGKGPGMGGPGPEVPKGAPSGRPEQPGPGNAEGVVPVGGAVAAVAASSAGPVPRGPVAASLSGSAGRRDPDAGGTVPAAPFTASADERMPETRNPLPAEAVKKVEQTDTPVRPLGSTPEGTEARVPPKREGFGLSEALKGRGDDPQGSQAPVVGPAAPKGDAARAGEAVGKEPAGKGTFGPARVDGEGATGPGVPSADSAVGAEPAGETLPRRQAAAVEGAAAGARGSRPAVADIASAGTADPVEKSHPLSPGRGSDPLQTQAMRVSEASSPLGRMAAAGPEVSRTAPQARRRDGLAAPADPPQAAPARPVAATAAPREALPPAAPPPAGEGFPRADATVRSDDPAIPPVAAARSSRAHSEAVDGGPLRTPETASTHGGAAPRIGDPGPVAARGGAGGTLAGVRTQEVLDQVIAARQQLTPQGGRIRVSLQPEELGTVDLDVTVRQNRVEVILVAERADVQQLLQSRGEEIRAALFRQEMKVDTFQVLVQDQGGGNPSAAGGWTPMGGERRGRREDARPREGHPGVAAPRSQPVRRSEGGLVSLFA